jgi:hypothetical protein
MRNASEIRCRENQNIYFMFNYFFFSENRVVFEIMWKNMVDPDRPHMTIRRMRFACWLTKAADTHSEYLTVIAFLQ